KPGTLSRVLGLPTRLALVGWRLLPALNQDQVRSLLVLRDAEERRAEVPGLDETPLDILVVLDVVHRFLGLEHDVRLRRVCPSIDERRRGSRLAVFWQSPRLHEFSDADHLGEGPRLAEHRAPSAL